MAVKLGMALGAGQPAQARQLCIISSTVALILCVLISFLIIRYSRQLGKLFTNDPELLDMYANVGMPLSAMLITFSMACFFERILMTMGEARFDLCLSHVVYPCCPELTANDGGWQGALKSLCILGSLGAG